MRVVHQMYKGLHSDLVVGAVQTHGLFRHGALKCVLGRLVVVGEGNDRTAHTEQHRWMNFAMCVSQLFGIVFQVGQIHRNETVFLLFHVQVLNETLLPQVIKGPLALQMLRLEFQSIVFNSEQRPHAPAGISVDLDFVLDDVPYDGNLL